MKDNFLIISRYFPPKFGGTSHVINNLFSGLKEKRKIYLITEKIEISISKSDNNILFLNKKILNSDKLNGIILNNYFYKWFLSKKLSFMIEKIDIKNIIIVYPDLYYLEIFLLASKKISKKNIYLYLHDTIYEGIAPRGYFKKRKVEKIQSLAFKLADKILTISEGLRQIYLKKYSIDSEVLPHINNNVIKPIEYFNIKNKDFLFGGSIYGINNISLKRMADVIQELDLKLEISTITNENYLINNGLLNNSNIKITNIPYSKIEYEIILNKKRILLLALNWPDETTVKIEELSSIFPTKLIDYLSFGNIIVAHCPKNYYLSKFIEENECGFVITSNDKSKIKEDIISILNFSDEKIFKVIKNSRRIANLYKKEIVVNKFILNRDLF